MLVCFLFRFCCCCFETVSHCIAQDDLELTLSTSLDSNSHWPPCFCLLNCWDEKCVTSCPAKNAFSRKWKVLLLTQGIKRRPNCKWEIAVAPVSTEPALWKPNLLTRLFFPQAYLLHLYRFCCFIWFLCVCMCLVRSSPLEVEIQVLVRPGY